MPSGSWCPADLRMLPDVYALRRLNEDGRATTEVVGIATDFCVRATAPDAVRARFDTTALPA